MYFCGLSPLTPAHSFPPYLLLTGAHSQAGPERRLLPQPHVPLLVPRRPRLLEQLHVPRQVRLLALHRGLHLARLLAPGAGLAFDELPTLHVDCQCTLSLVRNTDNSEFMWVVTCICLWAQC